MLSALLVLAALAAAAEPRGDFWLDAPLAFFPAPSATAPVPRGPHPAVASDYAFKNAGDCSARIDLTPFTFPPPSQRGGPQVTAFGCGLQPRWD